jgi:hypothetical protein
MPQTKADRQAAAKKAAATRQRNAQKARSEASGQKAASTRQARAATSSLDEARRALGSIPSSLVDSVTTVAKAVTTAVREGVKALISRVGAGDKR